MLGRLQAGQHMEYGPVLMAQLRGKLPTDIWLSSEDLLTSAVFGTLKNSPDAMAAALLFRAQPLEGSRPLLLSPPLRWRFWPSWDICEPDVVLEDDENLCVIEAKLYSDFGEDAVAGHQLRREWIDGLRRAQDEGKELWLIALTNHTRVPEEAIRRQLARADADPCRICWLSWLEVGRFLRNVPDDPTSGWAEDLLELLSRMGLAPFDGFRQVAGRPTGLPWVDRMVLGEGRAGAGGLGSDKRPAPTPANVGFGPALAVAREYIHRGGAQWSL